MRRTTVYAPRAMLELARERGMNFSEIFREALRISLNLGEETDALEQEAANLQRKADLLREEAKRTDDEKTRRDSMFASFIEGGRPLGDRYDLAWIRSRKKEFRLKEDPHDLLRAFKNRAVANGREIA